MEKLQRRSDGIAETLSGMFAVSPRRVSGKDSDHKWFEYRRTATAPVTRVIWRIEDGIAVIDQNVAMYMLTKRYASTISDAELSSWNDKVDELDLDAPTPTPVPIAETNLDVIEPVKEITHSLTGTQTPATATTTAATQQTAPEGQENGTEGIAGGTGTVAGEGTGTESGAGVSEGTDQSEQDETVVEEEVDETETVDESTKNSEGDQPKGKKKASKGLL